MGRTSAQGGSNPLISETSTNTEDEISKTRQYETRRDQEVWAGSHDLPWSTGIQASRSREPVTVSSLYITGRQPPCHHGSDFHDNIYRWFGLPRKMISDRDPRFTLHFARALAAKLGVQQNLSTAFHPQTDRLSKRKNQWIEQYLRLLTAGQQNDWSQWLMIVMAVHNDRTNEMLGISPNEVLFGFQPTLFPAQPVKTPNELAESRIDLMHQKRAQATTAINHAANHPFIPTAVFRENDQVWLESKHLALSHQSKKLAPKRVGPFCITR